MTMTSPQQYDPNDFLMGGGIPSAKFPFFGTTVSGTICAQPEVVQQTDPKDGSPKFWDDGRPRMQLVVTVQTEQRDPEIADDDGRRKFYIKAKLQDAVRQAVRTSGARGLEVGGTLTITYVADGEKPRGAFSAPKLYTAVYAPPSVAASAEFLNGGAPAGQPSALAQAAAPEIAAMPNPVQAAYNAAQTAPAPAAAWTPPPGSNLTPEQVAAFAKLTPDQRAQILGTSS
ncbi:hypothetical protein [Streptosporangium sp. G12]